MTADSLTRVGVDMKEYIEQREMGKRRDGSRENERGRTSQRGKKAWGESAREAKEEEETRSVGSGRLRI